MEKKDKKQRDIVLSQDNALTTARYKFDLIEKRALYSIIRNIRAQYIENENGRRDLFDDLIITIHEEELKKCGDNTKMQNIYDALKRLRNRDIEINNEKMWLSIGFVNYVKHIKNKSYFEVQVSKEVLPYYVELAQNFTSYSMTVAI
ncbi:replication initiation protein, partial [Phocaeicola vulgatus]